MSVSVVTDILVGFRDGGPQSYQSAKLGLQTRPSREAAVSESPAQQCRVTESKQVPSPARDGILRS